MPIFTDENIERLFGAEDAEYEVEERFRQYFVYNRSFESLTADLPIRILVGHKGVGKSALLRRAFLDDMDKNTMAVWLRPGEVSLMFQSAEHADTRNFAKLVEHWKQGILGIVARQVLGDAADELLDSGKMGQFAVKVSSFVGVLTDKLVSLVGKKVDTNRLIVEQFCNTGIINVYIDDIDRGWSASRSDIKNISALINAMRDISGTDQRIRFRLGLRTDVYFLVRTSDESTDKIERNIVWLSWSNHEILCIIAFRIETFFGIKKSQDELIKMSQSDISNKVLAKVIEPVYLGTGVWSNKPIHNVLLSLTRRRPRDLVKLMQGAAKLARADGSDIITTGHLTKSFVRYSNERLTDIVNEYKSELPQVEKLLLAMKPTKAQKRAAENFLFTNDKISTKLSNIMSNINLQFTNGRPVNGKSLIQFLYKIEFITARKDFEDGRIDRQFFDNNRFLANEFADFGYDWEIHPAYRWALQPSNIQEVIESLSR